jgi:3-oxoacyl-[acyl-carrier protein] reductase
MNLGIDNKVALVTAASKGIGQAIALELVREGAQVLICSRSEDRINESASYIEQQTGKKVLALTADVSTKEGVDGVLDQVLKRYGRIDMLVANAGGPPGGQFMDFADEDWQKAFDTNVMSVVRLVRGVVPSMRKTGGGRILTVASTSVKVPIQGLVLSNVMRTGVAGLMKTLSIELGPDNILVNTVCPGRIATDRVRQIDEARADKQGIAIEKIEEQMKAGIPLGRYGTPEEFARTAAFLLSDANTYVTGSTLMIDGGMVTAL